MMEANFEFKYDPRLGSDEQYARVNGIDLPNIKSIKIESVDDEGRGDPNALLVTVKMMATAVNFSEVTRYIANVPHRFVGEGSFCRLCEESGSNQIHLS